MYLLSFEAPERLMATVPSSFQIESIIFAAAMAAFGRAPP